MYFSWSPISSYQKLVKKKIIIETRGLTPKCIKTALFTFLVPIKGVHFVPSGFVKNARYWRGLNGNKIRFSFLS